MRIVLSVMAAFSSSRLIRPSFGHRQIRDPVAVLLEALARVDHRLVLGDRRDDVIPLLPIHLGDAFNRQVVGLGRAAREDNFLRVRADEIRHLLARLVHRFFGFPAEGMVAARRVAEMSREIRDHDLHDARIDRRGRVIVHVDRELDSHIFFTRRTPKGPPYASFTNACAVPPRVPEPARLDPMPARRSYIRRAPPESCRAP